MQTGSDIDFLRLKKWINQGYSVQFSTLSDGRYSIELRLPGFVPPLVSAEKSIHLVIIDMAKKLQQYEKSLTE